MNIGSLVPKLLPEATPRRALADNEEFIFAAELESRSDLAGPTHRFAPTLAERARGTLERGMETAKDVWVAATVGVLVVSAMAPKMVKPGLGSRFKNRLHRERDPLYGSDGEGQMDAFDGMMDDQNGDITSHEPETDSRPDALGRRGSDIIVNPSQYSAFATPRHRPRTVSDVNASIRAKEHTGNVDTTSTAVTNAQSEPRTTELRTETERSGLKRSVAVLAVAAVAIAGVVLGIKGCADQNETGGSPRETTNSQTHTPEETAAKQADELKQAAERAEKAAAERAQRAERESWSHNRDRVAEEAEQNIVKGAEARGLALKQDPTTGEWYTEVATSGPSANDWEVAQVLLAETLDRTPTNAEIQQGMEYIQNRTGYTDAESYRLANGKRLNLGGAKAWASTWNNFQQQGRDTNSLPSTGV